jgi:regulatory protein|tara:strand:+ start:232 stop:672 length:441 start_codon:yes stop_codon:yes gene_type:complete
MRDELISNIYNQALDIISKREHSEKEVTSKLLQKFNEPDLVDLTISRLKDNNLVNDERYAEIYIRIRKRKGFGPIRIKYELSFKGIDGSLSSAVIKEVGGWQEAAKNAFNKKFKKGIALEYKDKAKQKNFLQNRGFTFQEIDSVFS